MRKILQRNLFTPDNKKYKYNDLPKNRNRFFRPKTALKKKESPTKIINRNILNSTTKHETYNSLSGANNTSNNYQSKKHYFSTEEDNIYSRIETENKQTSIINNILPSISNVESFMNNKRAKTATERFKKKISNIANMFKNEPKLYSSSQQKIIFKHRGLMPGIPNDLLSRLKLVFNIFKNPNLIEYAQKAPSKRQSSLEKMTDYLWSYNDNHTYLLEFYALFFYYLCTNMQYDIKEQNKNENDLNTIFKSGFANSLQFCKLYEYMCKRNFLRVKRIEGFCKSKELPHYKKGSDVTIINHYWNAIYVNKEWYFCDLTFGSGGIRPRNEFKKKYFSPYYFLTPPDNLIETHRPIDDLWQMTTKIIPANQFSFTKEAINFGDFYKNVYEHSIDLVTHKYPIIKCDNNKQIYIQIGVKEMAIQAFLYCSNFKTRISEVKFGFNTEESIFTLEPVFPSNGEYWLEILFREFASNEVQYLPLINYKIVVVDSQEQYIENIKKQKLINLQREKLMKELKKKRPKSRIQPNVSRIIISRDQIKFNKKEAKICLDNEGAHLISPNSNNVKIGQINEFKVKVPNSEAVCVLDGRQWNYLKRNKKDKNLWHGSVEIQNENILILSMKDNKIFTEVFVLKAHYVTSHLLRLSQRKRDFLGGLRNMKKPKKQT